MRGVGPAHFRAGGRGATFPENGAAAKAEIANKKLSIYNVFSNPGPGGTRHEKKHV
jgi:nicotinamidase-related amidase